MLNFLGLGSAFNTKLGNTSGFLKEKDSMLLIDCGGTVFHRINELALMKDVKNLYIIITHTHPDHVGSLGEVIFYAYFVLKIKPKLYYPEEELIRTFFTCVGVEDYMVDIHSETSFIINDFNLSEFKLKFIPTSHLYTVKSYGFILNDQNQTIYYSGDANDIPEIIINRLIKNQIDTLYQDTCGLEYDGNAHLSLNQLIKLIPEKYRNKVYCIHHDESLDINYVKKLGFKVPTLYG